MICTNAEKLTIIVVLFSELWLWMFSLTENCIPQTKIKNALLLQSRFGLILQNTTGFPPVNLPIMYRKDLSPFD